METSTSWDGSISVADFYIAANALSERWKKVHAALSEWRWVCCPQFPWAASHKEEGYLVLENVCGFMFDEEEDHAHERHCRKDKSVVGCADRGDCEEDSIDNLSLVQIYCEGAIIYDLHIVYSSSFRVPVLYFCAYRSGGQPLGFGEIEQALPPHSLKLLREARWTFITREEHPYLNRPWFMLHPCGTSDWMKLLFDGTTFSKDLVVQQYLLSWLSVISQAIGLKISLEMEFAANVKRSASWKRFEIFSQLRYALSTLYIRSWVYFWKLILG